jgi:hypothetical protein
MPATRQKKMIPVEREDIPQFTSEAEEAAFWSTHTFGPGLIAEMRPNFDPELPSPDEFRAELEQRRRSRGDQRTLPLPIRIDADVLKRLRALALIKHTGYQTLLKTFVVERLYEEEKREGLI